MKGHGASDYVKALSNVFRNFFLTNNYELSEFVAAVNK